MVSPSRNRFYEEHFGHFRWDEGLIGSSLGCSKASNSDEGTSLQPEMQPRRCSKWIAK